jgi:citrate lyase beta subunit
MKNKLIHYSVGALMYCPANNKSVKNKITSNAFGDKYSLAFCLEDTINDNKVEEAESILVDTIQYIYDCSVKGVDFHLPKIFIRVRRPDQISNLMKRFGDARKIITGFNTPKFDMSNIDAYIDEVEFINIEYGSTDKKYYIMPILESHEMISLQTRYDFLYSIKAKLDSIEDLVLNIRVGGNDLSHVFGLRRHSFETVYDIKPVADILIDILTVFSQDYVVSGAVWEYYNGENWDLGLAEEVRKDITAGFIGKTVIHPKQIDVFNNACKVLKEDYEDAKAILDWSMNADSMVRGSNLNSRMNEYKTHYNWARKVLFLAEYYGVK